MIKGKFTVMRSKLVFKIEFLIFMSKLNLQVKRRVQFI